MWNDCRVGYGMWGRWRITDQASRGLGMEGMKIVEPPLMDSTPPKPYSTSIRTRVSGPSRRSGAGVRTASDIWGRRTKLAEQFAAISRHRCESVRDVLGDVEQRANGGHDVHDVRWIV